MEDLDEARPLRRGWTTGACATASAKAAFTALLTGAIGLWTVQHGWGPMGLVYASGSGMVAAALLNGGRLWWTIRRLRRKS